MNDLLVHDTTKLQIDSITSSKNLNAVGLEGDYGSGKSLLALQIASEILEVSKISDYPYLLQIDCQENSGIETSRNIKEFLSLKVPSDKSFNRCIILNYIENLSDEAQNALLKTLEEPPAKTFIIVTTNSKSQVRPTITSRVQWVVVLPVTREVLNESFAGKHSEEELNYAFAISKGNYVSFTKSLSSEDASKTDYIDLAKKILSYSRFEKMCEVDKLIKNKDISTTELLGAMTQILRAVLMRSIKNKNADSKQIVAKIEKINNAQNDLAKNANEKLVISGLFYHL